MLNQKPLQKIFLSTDVSKDEKCYVLMKGSIFFNAMLRCSRKSGYETRIKVTATYSTIHTNTANTTIISSSPAAIIKAVILKSVDLTLLSYYCVSQITFIQKWKKGLLFF